MRGLKPDPRIGFRAKDLGFESWDIMVKEGLFGSKNVAPPKLLDWCHYGSKNRFRLGVKWNVIKCLGSLTRHHLVFK